MKKFKEYNKLDDDDGNNTYTLKEVQKKGSKWKI